MSLNEIKIRESRPKTTKTTFMKPIHTSRIVSPGPQIIPTVEESTTVYMHHKTKRKYQKIKDYGTYVLAYDTTSNSGTHTTIVIMKNDMDKHFSEAIL